MRWFLPSVWPVQPDPHDGDHQEPQPRARQEEQGQRGERCQRNDRVALAVQEPAGAAGGHGTGRLLRRTSLGQVAKRTPRSARVAAALARVTRSSCSPGSSRPARQCSPSSAITLSRSALPTRAVFPYTVVRPGHFAVLVAREVHPARQQPHARPVARVVCHGIHSRLSGPRHPGASGRR